MGRNLIRKTLISANILMILLCFYTWYKEPSHIKEIEQPSAGAKLPPLQIFEHKRNLFKSRKANVITQVRVFPRGGDDLMYADQPWVIPPVKIYKSLEELDLNERYLMSNFSYSPGLGNLMFQYASLRSLAEDHHATLLLPSTTLLRRAFGNFDNKVKFLQPSVIDEYLSHNKAKEFNECCKFYSNISLFANDKKIEIINGYFQSFKYFHPHREDFIKRQFNFLPEIISRAQKTLEDAKFKLWDEELNVNPEDQGNDVVIKLPDTFDSEYYFVGIHVRHGLDITMHSRNIKHGHTFASVPYYQKAIQHFVQNFNWRKLIFVVAGDDMTWAKKVFALFPKEKFLYIDSGQREIDMATLSLCNAVVMSTGTFSWWAAYLANGPIVYYSDWPRRGSELEALVCKGIKAWQDVL